MAFKALLKGFQEKLIFVLFLLFPTQLAKHFWLPSSYVWGIRVDYLSLAIHISDIAIIALLFIFFIDSVFIRKKLFGKYSFLICVYAVLNTLFSLKPEVAIIKWIKILEIGLLAYFFSSFRFSNVKKQILLPLLISGTVVSLLGIAQFIKGSTLGGLFYFLGERSFDLASPGIALVDINGRSFLRAYSTFSHPNSMAGYLLILGLLIFYAGKGYRLLLVPILITFLLTFSKGAWVAILGVFLLNRISKRSVFITLPLVFLISFVMFFWPKGLSFNDIKISERMSLMHSSRELILDRPLVGVGMNNFILANPDWLLQPVHNIFVLALAEGGFLGLGTMLFVFNKAIREASKKQSAFLVYSLLAISVTGLFDHYWLTLQQNMLMLALVFGLTFNKNIK